MEAAQVPWRRLGELFVSRGLIRQAELETALAEQAATGKRLGEILVDRGLVSGPDLTSALMDQLGTEISKEEGFGSGLWAEIKRRHRRALPEGPVDEEVEAGAEISLVPPFEPGAGYEPEPTREPGPEPIAPPPAAVQRVLEPEHEPDDTAALRAELEQARADVMLLQGMLVDAMTALTALTAEATGRPYAG